MKQGYFRAGQRWRVTPQSNRVGLRLAGEVPLDRAITGELPSEGTALGALQVPPSGQPVLFLSDQAIVPVAENAPTAATFFNSLSSPVIILFMGGFLLADCAAKFKVDRALCALLLRPFLKNARLTLLGIMLITAVLGMFMSNTATTAAMFAIDQQTSAKQVVFFGIGRRIGAFR